MLHKLSNELTVEPMSHGGILFTAISDDQIDEFELTASETSALFKALALVTIPHQTVLYQALALVKIPHPTQTEAHV